MVEVLVAKVQVPVGEEWGEGRGGMATGRVGIGGGGDDFC